MGWGCQISGFRESKRFVTQGCIYSSDLASSVPAQMISFHQCWHWHKMGVLRRLCLELSHKAIAWGNLWLLRDHARYRITVHCTWHHTIRITSHHTTLHRITSDPTLQYITPSPSHHSTRRTRRVAFHETESCRATFFICSNTTNNDKQ